MYSYRLKKKVILLGTAFKPLLPLSGRTPPPPPKKTFLKLPLSGNKNAVAMNHRAIMDQVPVQTEPRFDPAEKPDPGQTFLKIVSNQNNGHEPNNYYLCVWGGGGDKIL